MTILITGANGFVGRALCYRLAADHVPFRAACRNVAQGDLPASWETADGVLSAEHDWCAALTSAAAVVHCAARVHVMKEAASDPLTAFRRVNVEGTLSLARQAAAAGVRRFLFISSVKVNGESTLPGHPFRADSVPAPLDPYGVSKMEAERALFSMARETGMEVVVIRPPLVYGPGVKANFLGLMRWLWQGVPLPLGAIHNARSLVGIDNLVDLIVTCIDHSAAANQRFLVSDGEDLSTTKLLRRMGEALGKPARLIPVPAALLQLGSKLLGRPDLARRLCASLQLDVSQTRDLLGWNPPVSVDEGLRRTAAHWLAIKR
ncbi:MAG: SDR family oxidoreductase [Candidatus Accumulibacter meliphilus]|jgi:nucleoside-diphosphate-sugar epimerase|uniref:UDP-glucose 4-epimerase family protein n=1 Tax=Candidatus Accumulibacter meliphilus TaxID=2211374 RepID=UPI002FC3AAAD